ncbi:hypothetical protein [Clostridium sp. Marseille-QA1073]
MNKKKIDEERLDKAIRLAQGNTKHEGIILNEEEKNLIKEHLTGSLSDEEFIEKVRKYAMEKE